MAKERTLSGMELHAWLKPYQPSDFQVLLGMDFIAMFHITPLGNSFILSN